MKVTAVADVFVLNAALFDTGPEGRRAVAIIGAESLIAPVLILVERAIVLRRR